MARKVMTVGDVMDSLIPYAVINDYSVVLLHGERIVATWFDNDKFSFHLDDVFHSGMPGSHSEMIDAIGSYLDEKVPVTETEASERATLVLTAHGLQGFVQRDRGHKTVTVTPGLMARIHPPAHDQFAVSRNGGVATVSRIPESAVAPHQSLAFGTQYFSQLILPVYDTTACAHTTRIAISPSPESNVHIGHHVAIDRLVEGTFHPMKVLRLKDLDSARQQFIA